MTKISSVRRGAGRLSADEAAKLGDRLLDAAQALFTEKGFVHTTMDDIAKKAGSSTQTIYARYTNKVELLEAVVRRVVEETVAGHVAATAPDARGIDPREFLISLGTRVVASLNVASAGLTRLAYAEGHRSEELRRLSATSFARGTGIIRNALEVWRDEGVLEPKGDLEALAQLCLSMMTDRARIRAVVGNAMSEQERLEHVSRAVDVFLHGCQGPR